MLDQHPPLNNNLYVFHNEVKNTHGVTVYQTKRHSTSRFGSLWIEFNVYEVQTGQLVATVRQHFWGALTYKWTIRYIDECDDAWHSTQLKFVLFPSWPRSFKVNGERYKFKGSFIQHDYDIVQCGSEEVCATAGLESRLMNGGGGSVSFKLDCGQRLPVGLVVALDRIGWL